MADSRLYLTFAPMKFKVEWENLLVRNGLALIALLAAYYIPDRFSFVQREGFARFSPYLFLLLMFGWIVFHNRILFERLYLHEKKQAYFLWTIPCMIFSSLNMHFILVYGFHQTDTLPKILTFWVFTLTGLGVYVIFLYLRTVQSGKPNEKIIPLSNAIQPTHFNCIVDGVEKQIPLDQILYVESLENYVKVNTTQKTHLVRLSMKEAEAELPKPWFLRISRSHIVNTSRIEAIDHTNAKINGQFFKIGKVYKRYVEEQLAVNSKNSKQERVQL
jgi:LytTr DNA-binding domain